MKTTLLASSAFATPTAFANAAGAAATGGTKRVEPQITAVGSAIPMPTRKTKRGSTSLYPFASLTEVGMSFGVKNKTAKQISGIISNANRKNKVKKTDEDGNVVFKTQEVKGQDGATTTMPTTEPEMVMGIHFFAVDVDAEMKKQLKGTDQEGSTVLVYRDQ